LVVERVGEAFGDDRTVPANKSCLPLRRSANKEFVGIDRAAPRPRHPPSPGFVTGAVALRCYGRDFGDQAARLHQIHKGAYLLSLGVCDRR
jgi:hypothetical protein